jgi:YbgC/YbaW family acyl-CoA thioester hydrolase
MTASFVVTRTVEFSDTDMAGIIHFARFFTYMESAEHAFLRSLGLSVSMEWEGQRIGFPRVNASCDFLSPVRFEDEVSIGVRVRKLGRSSVSYVFDMTLDGKPVARGQITAVCCRFPGPGKFEAIDIPADIRTTLEATMA